MLSTQEQIDPDTQTPAGQCRGGRVKCNPTEPEPKA